MCFQRKFCFDVYVFHLYLLQIPLCIMCWNLYGYCVCVCLCVKSEPCCVYCVKKNMCSIDTEMYLVANDQRQFTVILQEMKYQVQIK